MKTSKLLTDQVYYLSIFINIETCFYFLLCTMMMNNNTHSTKTEDYLLSEPYSRTSLHFGQMKAVLPSLKSCFSRLVIKMWQAVADMSIQRHATRLIMFFNLRMEREQPTLGSLSMSCTPNGLKRVQLNPTVFWPRSDYVMKSEGRCWIDWAEKRVTGSLHPQLPHIHSPRHAYCFMHPSTSKKTVKAFSPGHCCE